MFIFTDQKESHFCKLNKSQQNIYHLLTYHHGIFALFHGNTLAFL